MTTAYRKDLATARKDKKIQHAIQQLYGYATFNHNRYSVLSTYNANWFFRRTHSTDGGVLEVAGPFLSNQPALLVEAFVGVLLIAENDWFQPSPTSSPYVPRKFAVYDVPKPWSDPYLLKGEEASTIHFERGVARSRAGCIVQGQWGQTAVFFKIVDETKQADLAFELDQEVAVYKHLGASFKSGFLGYIRV